MSDQSIHEAAAWGKLDQVKVLLKKDPSLVNADDQHEWRPIFHAGLWRHTQVVQYLIDQGADLAAHDGYVMHYAGEVPDNKDVVEILIKYGALDAHAQPQTDLERQFIAAVFLANASRVKAMLRDHPELSIARYARGETALHHAARNGDAEIIDALLDQGADVDVVSSGGQFPLYCAAGHGHDVATRLLLARGADRNAKLPDGKTALDWARQYAKDNPAIAACVEAMEQE